VLAVNQIPDHVTIARFRVRHEQDLAGFLVASLKLCAAAGMVRVGTVALDGTKLAANASDKANRTHKQLEAEVAEILRQAAEVDQRGSRARPGPWRRITQRALATKAGRLARLRQAKAQLEADAAAHQQAYQQRVATHTATAAAKGRTPRALRRRPQETSNPDASVNVTDADSRFLHSRNGTCRATTPKRSLPCTSWSWPLRSPPRPTTSTSSSPCWSPPLHAGRRRNRRATRGAVDGLRLLVDRQPQRDPTCPRPLHPAGQAWSPGQAPQGRQAVGVPKRRPLSRDDGQA
jgi:hypothetical protein